MSSPLPLPSLAGGVSDVGRSAFQKRKRPRLDGGGQGEDVDDEDFFFVIGVQERRFFERVKGSLRSPTLYNEFLSLLSLHQNSLITIRELFSLTADILGPTSVLQVELKKLFSSLVDPADNEGI